MIKRKYYNALRIINRDGNRCTRCGETDFAKIIVHHLDINPSNNKDSNLITLCKKCHAFVHGQTGVRIYHAEIVELREMGLTFAEIAEIVGLTRQRVFQKYHRSLEKHN